MISKNLEASLNRVLLIASNFNLKYAKVEHLLLALTKNVDVNYVLSRYNIRADKTSNTIVCHSIFYIACAFINFGFKHKFK